LPLAAAFAILEFIDGPVRTDPWQVSKPLHNELAGMRGARRGEYRLILKIDDDEHVVRVLRIDHRADIYHAT
jgi:mRNA-degrading endonuclease RelE of RelBE toxin-antitoxin system